MAQRRKRMTLRRGRSAVGGRAGKRSKPVRRKAAKRSTGKLMPREHLKKNKRKRSRAKKGVLRPARPMQRQPVLERETVIVDVVDEPIPGVITVTEFEETEVREGSRNRDQPEED
jgi:hypothetical protein